MPNRPANCATSRRRSSPHPPNSGCRCPAATTPNRANGRASTGLPRKVPPASSDEWFNRVVLSIEEISDRLEIQQLLIAYSTAIDSRRFDDLDQVFTGDAYIDY